MKNRTIAFIRIDNMIDLITNSSSELFTIKADQPLEIIEALVKEAMDGIGYSIDSCRLQDGEDIREGDWVIENALAVFAPEDREEIREKYLSKAKYYAVIVDRDDGYHTDYAHHYRLKELGFELITIDF